MILAAALAASDILSSSEDSCGPEAQPVASKTIKTTAIRMEFGCGIIDLILLAVMHRIRWVFTTDT
jgi:hypothetical protein